ncbi:MAG: 4-hydroxy-tetrahydrodipicolinate synthase [Mucinivorans sp.]
MNSCFKISGVGVALITPFDELMGIDYEALTRLIDSVTAAGVDFLVVLGTTGEPATLTKAEKRQVVAHCVAHSRLPIVVGIGGNNTAQVIEDILDTDLTGVSAILSVAPYYNKPNQAGIYAHFAAIAQASPLPVILYNVPGRTGVNMNCCTILRLAHDFRGKIIAIKEASGNMSQVAYLLRGREEGFAVISGDDNTTLPLVALGGDGVISVSVNAFPEKFTKMVHAAIGGDFATARSLNMELYGATDMLFEEGNPVGVKAALACKGMITNKLRLPLVESSEQLNEKLAAEIKKYGL